MLDEKYFDRLLTVLPDLQKASPEIINEFRRVAFYAKIPAGHDVFTPGDPVQAIALLIGGSIRVYKLSDTGRAITLYRFSAGESCILSANAILNNEQFAALATVEDDAEAVMIPSDVFQQWVDRYPYWREFVFDLLSQRLLSVMEIVDEVAFGRMDRRVAGFLLERSTNENPLHITHQEIADELGSSREVMSRILGSFAGQNLIRMGRGTIEILDFEAISALM